MVIESTNIFHSKAHQNLPKLGFFGLKINHLATLLSPRKLWSLWSQDKSDVKLKQKLELAKEVRSEQ
jgi:hypothetical protein